MPINVGNNGWKGFKESQKDARDEMNTYHTSNDPIIVDQVLNKMSGYSKSSSYGGKSSGTPPSGIPNQHLFDFSELGHYDDKEKKFKERLGYHTAESVEQKRLEFWKGDIEAFEKGSNYMSDPDEMLKNRFSRFTRYGYLDMSGEFLTGTREYLFFSKPDLHLMNPDGTMYEPLTSNPFLCEAYKRYRYSYYSLQQYFGGNTTISGDSSVGPVTDDSKTAFDIKSLYIPLLSNMATSTLDLGDITAGEVENNKNLYGITTTYREGSLQSDLGYDFSIEFKDTKWLDVYMLFKIYDEYNRHKYFAEIEPNRQEYITSRIYPEAISIWKLIVDDTDRIIYWAKATGCVPMSVPRGSVSNLEGVPKFTVNWKAQFISDMNPMHLAELNVLSRFSLNNDSRLDFMTSGNTWVGYPYIFNGKNEQGFNMPARTGDHSVTDEQRFYKLAWCW